MAGRWLEGFETHQNASQLSRKYASASGSITAAAGRVFGSCAGVNTLVAVTPSLGVQNTYTIGFGLRIASQFASLSTNHSGFYLEKSTTEQCHVEFLSNAGSFEVRVCRGATVLATTAQAFGYGIWHYFELQVTVRTSTNGAYELRWNEINVASATGVNVANAASDGADIFAIRFAAAYGANVQIDDIYCVDSTGSANNTFLGDFVIEGRLPNAAGTTTQWTNDAGSGSNFNNVQDPGTAAPDETGAGGTNSSNTSGQKDTYNFQDLANISGSISFVQVGVQMAMAAVGSRDVKIKYRDDGGTEADVSTVTVASTAYDEFIAVMDANPAVPAPWDITDINGGEFGVEVV